MNTLVENTKNQSKS